MKRALMVLVGILALALFVGCSEDTPLSPVSTSPAGIDCKAGPDSTPADGGPLDFCRLPDNGLVIGGVTLPASECGKIHNDALAKVNEIYHDIGYLRRTWGFFEDGPFVEFLVGYYSTEYKIPELDVRKHCRAIQEMSVSRELFQADDMDAIAKLYSQKNVDQLIKSRVAAGIVTAKSGDVVAKTITVLRSMAGRSTFAQVQYYLDGQSRRIDHRDSVAVATMSVLCASNVYHQNNAGLGAEDIFPDSHLYTDLADAIAEWCGASPEFAGVVSAIVQAILEYLE